MDQTLSINSEFLNRFEGYAVEGVKSAASGFSSMLGESLKAQDPTFKQVPITEIPKLLGGPETEAVGIYLRAEGDVPCQFMLVIPLVRSMELVDLLLDQAPGTTKEMGSLERSALGEIGNLTSSYFLNSICRLTGLSVRPSPPAVMVDMVGAIMDIIIATCGGISDSVLLVQTKFANEKRSFETSFWVIPDNLSLEVLSTKGRG
jgi:chemotaxis protein CheC